MRNIIKIRRLPSSKITTDELITGELTLNSDTGNLFIKDETGRVHEYQSKSNIDNKPTLVPKWNGTKLGISNGDSTTINFVDLAGPRGLPGVDGLGVNNLISRISSDKIDLLKQEIQKALELYVKTITDLNAILGNINITSEITDNGKLKINFIDKSTNSKLLYIIEGKIYANGFIKIKEDN